MAINNKTLNGEANLKEQQAWKKPPPKRMNSWKIRAYIY
jgi:hypothetical protein